MKSLILLNSLPSVMRVIWGLVANSRRSFYLHCMLYIFSYAAYNRTAIAHDIREQVQMYQRSLIVIGHRFDGSLIQDEELRQALLPPVTKAARNTEQAAAHMPLLNNLSEGEIENQEKEREKDMKRKKRQAGRRRGMALPDREPVKTYRTLPGCADIGQLSAAAAAVASLPSTRRAAMVAQRTIADLVAQENSNGYITPPIQTPTRDTHLLSAPSTSQPRAKRQKTGHVRPPTLPSTVLRPRAKRDATSLPPSTGLEVAPRPHDPSMDGVEDVSASFIDLWFRGLITELVHSRVLIPHLN